MNLAAPIYSTVSDKTQGRLFFFPRIGKDDKAISRQTIVGLKNTPEKIRRCTTTRERYDGGFRNLEGIHAALLDVTMFQL